MYLSQKKFRAAATRIFAGALTLTASLTAYGGEIVYQNGFESTAKFMEFTQVNDIPSYEDLTLEWEYSRTTESAFINLYESDYWAFLTTPALQLKADCTYSFSLTATLDSRYSNQAVWCYISTDNTLQAIRKKRFLVKNLEKSTDPQSVEGELTVAEDGIYYISILKGSVGDACGLFVDDVKLEVKHMLAAPSYATSLTAVADAYGALSAEISFQAPETDIEGSDLDLLEKIELYRGETLIHTFTSPAPGAELSFTDTDAAQGFNSYNVYAYNQSGKGSIASVEVFVGADVPGLPTSVTLTDNGTDATLSWIAPETGANLGYIDPETISYTITDAATGTIIATGVRGTSHTITPETVSTQTILSYGVAACNTQGTGEAVVSNTISFGTPYDAPFAESFADVSETAGPWEKIILRKRGANDPAWLVRERPLNPIGTAQDNDFGTISFRPMSSSDIGELRSAKINISDLTSPVLEFHTHSTSPNHNTLAVAVASDGGEFVTVKEINTDELNHDGWNKVTVPLSDFGSSSYIRIGFIASCLNSSLQCVHIDNIKVKDSHPVDLAVTAITAPNTFTASVPSTVSVNVRNDGEESVETFTLNLMQDDITLSTLTGAGSLAPSEEKVYSFDVTFAPAAPATINLSAVIICADDENPENDQTSAVEVSVLPSPYAAPSDLNVITDGTACTLTWKAPAQLHSQQITEGFEHYNVFLHDNIGNWTVTDADGLDTGRPSGQDGNPLRFPGAGTPMAFMVLDNAEAGLGSNWGAHSGNNALTAFAAAGGNADDWLISPLLAREPGQISLFARNVSELYGNENIEILVSSTDKETTSFTSLKSIKLEGRWNEYKADLPEGTRYFAIRHTSTDALAMLLDDITYSPEYLDFDNIPLTSYAIYCDEVKIGEAPADATEFSTEAAEGEHEFHVSALYGVRESSSSNVIRTVIKPGAIAEEITTHPTAIGGAGYITVMKAGNRNVTVTSADGKTLYDTSVTDSATIDLPAGIYVVRIGADYTVKTIVR